MSAELQSLKSSLEQEINEIKEQEDLQKKLDNIRTQIYALDDKNFTDKLNDIKSKTAILFKDLGFNFTQRALPEQQEECVFSYSSFVFKFVFPNPSQGYFGYRSVIEVDVSKDNNKQQYRMGIFAKKEPSLNTEGLPLRERIETLEQYLSTYVAKSYDISTVNMRAKQQNLLVTDLNQFTDHIEVILKDFKK
ncbi:hypothetical protein [Acinetobacter sp. TSRC1-2]|uniref:hypothetical protein n=1 Tax=unclassified Acinetobacter TaxID=196816 RepID=UPI003CF9ADD0